MYNEILFGNFSIIMGSYIIANVTSSLSLLDIVLEVKYHAMSETISKKSLISLLIVYFQKNVSQQFYIILIEHWKERKKIGR